jgi:uncharacterized protein YcbK (DUF882 family)
MISRQEILKGKILPDELEPNLVELLIRINKVRDAYGKPMTVTSGYRTRADQIAVYNKKGIHDLTKIPMGSKHISCQAVDISDPKRELQKWIQENLSLMEEIGLWFENFDVTTTWVHCQTVPPKSNARFFKP